MSIIYQQTRRSIDAACTYRLEFCKHLHDDIEIVAVKTGHVIASIDTIGYDLYPGDILLHFPIKFILIRVSARVNAVRLLFYPPAFPGIRQNSEGF